MAIATLPFLPIGMMKTSQTVHVQSVSFSLAVTLAINNHHVAQVRELLEMDPHLLENYQPVIDHLNEMGRYYSELTRAEQLRHHYFAQMLNEHLTAQQTKSSRILTMTTACIISGALMSCLYFIRNHVSIPKLLTKSQSLFHDPNILGPIGLAFVSLELTLLTLRLSGFKPVFSSLPVEEHTTFSSRAIAASFDAGRIALRYLAYGLLLGFGAVLSTVCMGILAVGEGLNVCKHIADWHNDYSHTVRSRLENSKKIHENESIFSNQPLENKIALINDNFQLQNANDMLAFDLNRKKSIIKVNTAYSVLLLAAYVTILFCPLGGPVVWGVAAAVALSAYCLKSHLLKKIDSEQEQLMKKKLEHNAKEYREALDNAFKACEAQPPKIEITLHPANQLALNQRHSIFAKSQIGKRPPYYDELTETLMPNPVLHAGPGTNA